MSSWCRLLQVQAQVRLTRRTWNISSFRLCISPAETNPILRDEKSTLKNMLSFLFHLPSTLVRTNPLPIPLSHQLCLVALLVSLPFAANLVCFSCTLVKATLNTISLTRIHMFFLIRSNPSGFDSAPSSSRLIHSHILSYYITHTMYIFASPQL